MPHGFTYGGHPVSAAVALANIGIIEREGLLQNVRNNEQYFGAQLRTLLDIDIVGDVRGAGYFWGVELVRRKENKEIFSVEEVRIALLFEAIL
jgi:adenosylmethionine-8-amino-7-oxononanoate aminotransferase